MIAGMPRDYPAPVSTTPETGTLVLADLTGYTAYLSRSEIEHGPVIAGDLLETVVGRLEPPFRLAKLEGDAAFLYVEDGRADGSLQLDAIEAAYVGFQRRLRSIDAATACDCAACSLAPRLDLKLFVHHGSFVHNRIAGRDELAGPDVILAHRLLKGAVASRRSAGFAQFTAAAAEHLGVPDLDELPREPETFEHIGETDTYVIDLDARWQAERDRREVSIDAADAVLDIDQVLPADPADAWAFLTSPAMRGRWEGVIVMADTTRGARRGVGTTMECVTGKLATLEEVVDWQPYEHVAWRIRIDGAGPVDATADLTPLEGGTRLVHRWAVSPGSTVTADALAAATGSRRDGDRPARPAARNGPVGRPILTDGQRMRIVCSIPSKSAYDASLSAPFGARTRISRGWPSMSTSANRTASSGWAPKQTSAVRPGSGHPQTPSRLVVVVIVYKVAGWPPTVAVARSASFMPPSARPSK